MLTMASEASQLLCLPALPSSQGQHRSEGSTEVKEAAAERRQLSQKRKHLKLTHTEAKEDEEATTARASAGFANPRPHAEPRGLPRVQQGGGSPH